MNRLGITVQTHKKSAEIRGKRKTNITSEVSP